jgi:hypothetical protein
MFGLRNVVDQYVTSSRIKHSFNTTVENDLGVMQPHKFSCMHDLGDAYVAFATIVYTCNNICKIVVVVREVHSKIER